MGGKKIREAEKEAHGVLTGGNVRNSPRNSQGAGRALCLVPAFPIKPNFPHTVHLATGTPGVA